MEAFNYLNDREINVRKHKIDAREYEIEYNTEQSKDL